MLRSAIEKLNVLAGLVFWPKTIFAPEPVTWTYMDPEKSEVWPASWANFATFQVNHVGLPSTGAISVQLVRAAEGP